MPTINNSREELLNLFPDNNSQLIEAKDLRAFVNAIYDEAVIIGEDVINDLNSAIIELPLSADQGRILDMTKEDYLGTPSGDDYVLSSDLNDNRVWIPQVRKLGQLDDVSTQDPDNGAVLTWDASKQLWVPYSVSASSFIEKGGVPWKSHISYQAGFVVTYQDNLYFSLVDMVPNRPPDQYPGGWQLIRPIEELSDLNDVDTSGSNIGYYLRSDEFGNYKATSLLDDVSLIMDSRLKEGLGIDITKESGTNDLKISLNAKLDDLQDVECLSPTLGSLLVYDGTNWVPEDIVETIDKGGTEWQSSSLYSTGTVVSYGGDVYISIYANIGERPDQSNAWEVYGLANLPDVNVRNVEQNDVITFNVLTQQWLPKGTTNQGGDSSFADQIPRLKDNGKLDSNMIEATMFHRIDSWDPSQGQEYPDTTGHTPGAFWDILFTGSETQWTYQTGDLVGKTVYPGDFIIWGIGGWTIMPAAMNPLDYYRRDGTQPITANFQADGYKIVNLQGGIDLEDAVNVSQLNTKENYLGLPSQNGYILQSDVNGNRSWIENQGGLQEVYWTDIQGTDPLANPELAEEFDKKANKDDVFDKSEHIDSFTGTPGVPIVTTSNGKISSDLVNIESLHYVGTWTPTSGAEYPDISNETPGAFWIVQGLAIPYTFMTGDLTGQVVDNGDYMVWGSNGWDIMESSIDPDLYYKIDGTVAITAPFAGGNQQIKNIAQGTENSDAINLYQHNQHKDNTSNPHQVTKAQIGLDNVENLAPEDMPISDDVQSALDGKENWLNNPPVDGMILSSTATGTRSWVYANDEATWGNIVGDINNQTDLMDEFSKKVNKAGDHITGDLQVDGNLKSPKVFLEAGSNYETALRFENISVGLNTFISWSNPTNKFTVSDQNGDVWDLLHTGVIKPEDYLLKSGGSMTGALHLYGLPTGSTEAANKEYVDSRTVQNPSDIMLKSVYDINDTGVVDLSEDAEMLGGYTPDYYATQTDLDQKLDLSGGSVTGDLEVQGQFTTTGSALLNQNTEITRLKVGIDPVTTVSRIDFADTNYSSTQSIYWSSGNREFRIENYTGTSYKIWHEGNLNPSALSRTVRKQFIGDGTTTEFQIPEGYTPWNANVYYNGVRLFEPDDVDISDGTKITFTVAPEVDDRIDFEGFQTDLIGDH